MYCIIGLVRGNFMDLEKYYRNTAVISLNASLISCIPIIMLSVLFMLMNLRFLLILLVLPFGIYSIITFVQFYLYKKRIGKMEYNTYENSVPSILELRTAVLTFLPAPSLRLSIFNGQGKQLGEIRDLNFSFIRWYLPNFIDRLYSKSYGFYNSEDMLQYVFIVKRNSIEIKNKQNKLISVILECPTTNRTITHFHYDEEIIIMEQKLTYTELQFYRSDGYPIASLTKGWMPKEWTKRFIGTNLPLLTINHHASDKEIIHLYSLLVKNFAYTNH